MLSRPTVAQRSILGPLLVAVLLGLSSCPPPGSGSGGITIAPSDGTSPSLSVGAGQPGGQNASVSATGTGQSMRLGSRTGMLNLLATASDPESGVQVLEIWVNMRTTSCDANAICSMTGPGLLSQPTFVSTSPKKQPGETTSASSLLADVLDLSTTIPQASVPAGGSFSADLIIHAVAVNHLGGRSRTPDLVVTWRQP